MKYFLLIFVLLFITADYADAKNCKKGKPCGNTCIARDKECHVDKSPYNPSIYNSSSDSIIYTTPRSSDSIIYTAPRRSSARPQISYECNGVIVSESQFKECNSPQISSEENGISTNTDDKNKKKSKRTTTVPTEILDADIFQPSGKKKKIRLYGIDAPEEGQAFYQEAKDMLEKLIYKKKITVKIYSDDSDEIDAAVG
jgi:endonuclease YncB( thermonuclease family)